MLCLNPLLVESHNCGLKTMLDGTKKVVIFKMSPDICHSDMFHYFGSYAGL